MSDKLSPNEGIKTKSHFLRGTITEGLNRVITGALAEDDTQLTKFHGTYQQDDRDLRPERRKKKMEQAYSFMIRRAGCARPSNGWRWIRSRTITPTAPFA